MYNIANLDLTGTKTYGFEESQMYCEFLGETSHLFEPRDDFSREQVLVAINATHNTEGHTMPLWINAKRSSDTQ